LYALIANEDSPILIGTSATGRGFPCSAMVAPSQDGAASASNAGAGAAATLRSNRRPTCISTLSGSGVTTTLAATHDPAWHTSPSPHNEPATRHALPLQSTPVAVFPHSTSPGLGGGPHAAQPPSWHTAPAPHNVPFPAQLPHPFDGVMGWPHVTLDGSGQTGTTGV